MTNPADIDQLFTARRKDRMKTEAMAKGMVNCETCGKPIPDMGGAKGWCSSACADADPTKVRIDRTPIQEVTDA